MGKPLKWTTEQKLPLVLSVLRGEGSVAEIGRRHRVSDVTLAKWRAACLAGGAAALASCRQLRRNLRRLGAPQALGPPSGRRLPGLDVLGGACPGQAWAPPAPALPGRETPAGSGPARCVPRAADAPLPRLAVRLQ